MRLQVLFLLHRTDRVTNRRLWRNPVFAGEFDMLGTAIKATAGKQFMSSPAE